MKTLHPAPQGRRLSRISIALILALLSAVPGIARAADEISSAARTEIQALLDEKESRTPAQQKLDSQLIYLAKQQKGGLVSAAAPNLVPSVKADADNRVLVDLSATVSAELLDAIAQGGGTVVNQFAAFNAIRALVPVGLVETLAARADVRSIAPGARAITNVGSALSEGDRTHRANTARTVTGATGSGIKIGVMSDGVNSLAASISNGNLNASASFLPGQAGAGDEGTAMMEIIQDLVPDAQLIFATAFNGDTSMAANIIALKDAGCSIIVDDVTYLNESPFQDGVISQAVNTVSAAGVMYFSSARNSGNKNDGTSGTWEGDFVSGGAVAAPVTGTGNVLNFGSGTTSDSVTGGNSLRVDFFWSDPAGASANDYDLFVLNAAGTSVLRSSTNVQNGTQDPYEATDTLNVGERIVIVQRAGAANRFLHLDIGRGILAIGTAGNVRGHNAAGAANAFSVAATDVTNSPSPNFFTGGATNPVETFSSDGPRRLFYTPGGTPLTPGNFSSTGGSVLNKPDITAADGVSTSVPGFSPFYGTSAAAPHAAAIAALIKSYNMALTPAQIRTALMSTALDIEAAGADRDSGVGIVTALAAIQSVAAPEIVISGPPLFAPIGLPGGPFNPAFTTYTLKNSGAVSLNWTAAKTQPWTTLSTTSGTLAPGASTTVTCSLNGAANALGLGSYSDTVTITDTTSGFGRNFNVSLNVVSALPDVAGTVLPNDNSTSGNSRAPIARFNYERSVYLITPAELAASGLPVGTAVKSIGWSYQTAPGLAGAAPLTIYLQNTGDTTNLKSTTWATAIGGMTTVHNATTNLPNVTGPFNIPFSGGSPFTYTGGGLYVAFDWGNYTGAQSGTVVIWCNSGGLANGILTQQSNSAPPTVTVAGNFRPETRLSAAAPAPGAPGIGVQQPAGTDLVDNSSTVAFGTVAVHDSSAAKTFTIKNTGTADLTSLAISTDGNAADFIVSGLSGTIIPAGGSTVTFTVTFHPGSGGAKAAAIHIASNVAGAANPFDINLTGTSAVPVTLSPVTIASNNPHSMFAKVGDQVTVSFTANQAIQTPAIGVLGEPTTVNNPSGNNWTGTATVSATTTEGQATFIIIAHDLAGFFGPSLVVATTDASFVIVDRTAPVLTLPSNITAEATSAAGRVVSFSASTSDNIDGAPSFSVVPPSGSVFPLGLTTVNVSSTDVAGNTANGSFTVTVQDTTAPTIGGTFSPLSIVTGTPLPDYTGQATTSDAVGVTSVTQSPPAGSPTPALGPLHVTLTAHDAAGNHADFPFDVMVTSAAAADPTHDARYTKGGDVPGAGSGGIPAGAKWSSFGVPAINDAGQVAYLGKWSSPAGSGAGIFVDNTLVTKTGNTTTLLAGATFKSFKDPLIDAAGHVAFLGSVAGTGTSSANDSVLATNAFGAVEVVARENDVLSAEIGTPMLKTFKSVSLVGGEVLFAAKLQGGTPAVTSADDDVGLRVASLGSLTHVVREGDTLGTTTVKSFKLLGSVSGSPAQNRAHAAGTATFLALLADHTQALVDSTGGTLGILEATDETTGGVALPAATFKSFGVPSADGTHLAFVSTLTSHVGGVLSTNAKGIFKGVAGAIEPVARLGALTGVDATTFGAFKDPVLAPGADSVAFPATLKGATSADNSTLWWKPASGPLMLLAREGAQPPEAPAGAQWKAFTTVALPGGSTGPLFLATLLKGAGGIDSTSDVGVWAISSTGALRSLFREGDTIAGKVVKNFVVLKAVSGTPGVTRAFNNHGQVVWRAAFTDGGKAIVVTQVP